jgi:ribosomal protein L40E
LSGGSAAKKPVLTGDAAFRGVRGKGKEEPMICTRCGAANRPRAKFCDECGQSLKPAAAEAPIPGPHPGMRYRRSAAREPLPQYAQQANPPKPEPTPPPPRREPPPAAPKREATAPVRSTTASKQETAASGAPMTAPPHRKVELQREPAPRTPAASHQRQPEKRVADAPAPDTPDLHRRVHHGSDVEITTPAPRKRKRGDSGDHDNATIMIVLALVFFAILAVGASGVYFNLRESRPDLLREKAERADAARNEQRKLHEEARFELPPPPDFSNARIGLELPAVPPIPESIVPRSNPAIPEPVATAPDARTVAQAEVQPVPQPEPLASTLDEAGTSGPVAQNDLAFSDAEVDEMIRNPNTSAGKPERQAYKAQFRQLFGLKVIERTYPTMEMKQRALQLWTREQKILEPDGTINDKYAPKPTSSPIPGH